MEALSRMLNVTMNQGFLAGFSVGSRDNKDLVVNQRSQTIFETCVVSSYALRQLQG
jgi:hypothetical protein